VASSASISRWLAKEQSRRAIRSSCPRGFKVTEIARLFLRDRQDVEGLERAAALDLLPESWCQYFRKRRSTTSSAVE
jgi:hypothetical protein